MVTSESPEGTRERAPGEVGRPLPGVSVRIMSDAGETPRELPCGEEGEVEVSGPAVFGGYWQQPAATAAVLKDGWLSTGDRGRLGKDGTLRLLGRSRELILSGGFNVYPVEVETVLGAHSAVLESAVFGLPDADLGERVAAAVVPAPGVQTDELPELLIAHCRDHLAAHKCPRKIVLLSALPRNRMGKLQRRVLAALPSCTTPD
jgi:malonyl-CoA/methylmalonyl-CoA synthetase